MKRIGLIAGWGLGIAAFACSFSVQAASLIVAFQGNQSVVTVDALGGQTTLVSFTGGEVPLSVKYGPSGAPYILSFDSDTGFRRLYTFSGELKLLSTFSFSVDDLLISSDGVPMLLRSDASRGVYTVDSDGTPSLFASTPISARGFTIGPGNKLYLAGEETTKILSIDESGTVSTYFDSGSPLPNTSAGFLDLRFDSNGDAVVLSRTNQTSNASTLYRISGGVASVFVPYEELPTSSIQMTIDDADNIFIVGGGFFSGGPPGYIEKVGPSGVASRLTDFPLLPGDSAAVFDIDDDASDGYTFVAGVSAVPIPNSLLLITSSFLFFMSRWRRLPGLQLPRSPR